MEDIPSSHGMNKKKNFWEYSTYVLIIACVFFAYLAFFNQDSSTNSVNTQFRFDENGTKLPDVQLVLINPVGCVEDACNDFSAEAQEYADLLNITFNRVAYPQETPIPALYMVTEGSMSLITGIEAKRQIGEYVCLVTRSRAACEKSGLLTNVTQNNNNTI